MANDPLTAAGLSHYALVFLVSLWGGVVAIVKRAQSGDDPGATTARVILWGGDLITSGFAGLIAFWVSLYFGFDMLFACIASAVAGNAGPKFIAKMHKAGAKWFESKTGIKLEPNDDEKI